MNWGVVNLFSGAGGMSYGFHAHPGFQILAAADAQVGKPSSGGGNLQCNITFARNIGINPKTADLGEVHPSALREILDIQANREVDVLLTCPPCTGFSRTIPMNHLRDDRRNSLVRKSAEFAVSLRAKIVVMENARELIRGNFKRHYLWFEEFLTRHNYNVKGHTYFLNRFGLPQIRERAIVIAARQDLVVRTLDDLWQGFSVRPEATTVKRAFASISPEEQGAQTYPRFGSRMVEARIRAIPTDGGAWMDLAYKPHTRSLLTSGMKRILHEGRIGSYPDIYGRMSWNRPAPTIKRECSHVGNGRYAHPTEDRLCSVREMAALQGFPKQFEFNGTSVSNMYRHIGDAVPPLISFQLAHVCAWILSGDRPAIGSVVLDGTHLRREDIVAEEGLTQQPHVSRRAAARQIRG